MPILDRILNRVRGLKRRKSAAVVAFDVLGTLVDLEPLRGALVELGLPDTALEPWLLRTLRDGLATEVSGKFVPFATLATSTVDALRVDHGLEADRDSARAFVDKLKSLPLFPDVAPAFRRLHDGGAFVVAVTNGSRASARATLTSGGVATYVDEIVSIDDVRHWKPHRIVYDEVARVAHAAPGDVTLVAAHGWDVHGAKRAGLRAAWIPREERGANSAFEAADVVLASLGDVVDGVLVHGRAAPRRLATSSP